MRMARPGVGRRSEISRKSSTGRRSRGGGSAMGCGTKLFRYSPRDNSTTSVWRPLSGFFGGSRAFIGRLLGLNFWWSESTYLPREDSKNAGILLRLNLAMLLWKMIIAKLLRNPMDAVPRIYGNACMQNTQGQVLGFACAQPPPSRTPRMAPARRFVYWSEKTVLRRCEDVYDLLAHKHLFPVKRCTGSRLCDF